MSEPVHPLPEPKEGYVRLSCDSYGPPPGSPEFRRFALLEVLVLGGLEVYREHIHEDPPPDMVAEAEVLRARRGLPPLTPPVCP